MRIGVERRLANPVQQLSKVGSPERSVRMTRRVDEEADQPFDLLTVAVGDRRADHDVVLAGVARQQHLNAASSVMYNVAPGGLVQLLECSPQIGRQNVKLIAPA